MYWVPMKPNFQDVIANGMFNTKTPLHIIDRPPYPQCVCMLVPPSSSVQMELRFLSRWMQLRVVAHHYRLLLAQNLKLSVRKLMMKRNCSNTATEMNELHVS
ncbi:hypothetical protein ILYODFUR_024434 [Ilyodon furcidens]|uniref:Uncharacterized protein n=1 Tax=Ilyodon furcidens TaxID=33524 RepID=A0ABV0T209_9TELE